MKFHFHGVTQVVAFKPEKKPPYFARTLHIYATDETGKEDYFEMVLLSRTLEGVKIIEGEEVPT